MCMGIGRDQKKIMEACDSEKDDSWFPRYTIDIYKEKLEKLEASIQTCLKCNQKYYAQSHEYPCPWCIVDKKLDAIDRAYIALDVSFIYDDPVVYIHAMKTAMKILEEQKEGAAAPSVKPDQQPK
jgi:DNA-binding helix-hairpin-helix protein with protein kinase domain